MDIYSIQSESSEDHHPPPTTTTDSQPPSATVETSEEKSATYFSEDNSSSSRNNIVPFGRRRRNPSKNIVALEQIVDSSDEEDSDYQNISSSSSQNSSPSSEESSSLEVSPTNEDWVVVQSESSKLSDNSLSGQQEFVKIHSNENSCPSSRRRFHSAFSRSSSVDIEDNSPIESPTISRRRFREPSGKLIISISVSHSCLPFLYLPFLCLSFLSCYGQLLNSLFVNFRTEKETQRSNFS